MTAVEIIRSRLFELRDEKYADFQSRLVPTLPREYMIGVRTPQLRALAKALAGSDTAKEFMLTLPHVYYDENNLHAFLIEGIKDYELCMAALEDFLPHIDNWATCDQLSPKILKKHPERLMGEIKGWLTSEHVYTVRFGMGMLMRYFLDERFEPKYLDKAASVQSGEYYINMMTAWFFATALAKQYDAALPYIKERRLPPPVHNKTIQKAIESYRLTDEQKENLREMKIKNGGTLRLL